MIQLSSDGDGILLPVKVVPGASRTRLMGEFDGRLKVAVAAPAEKGKANEALVEFMAKRLGVRRQAIQVVAGQTSPLKMLRIAGASPEKMNRLLP